MAKQAKFFSSEDYNYADATLTIDNIYALTETQTAFIEIDEISPAHSGNSRDYQRGRSAMPFLPQHLVRGAAEEVLL